MMNPPLGASTWPVKKSPAGLAKNQMAWATSSGVPRRSKGVSSARAARVSGERAPFMAVSITPGATQLTVIPEGPTSLARARVKPMTPALAAE